MYTNLSFWERETFLSDIDVCVVGAGIVGLNAAIHLKTSQPKLRVIVVDRSPLPYGASTRNAGFACFGSMSEILADMRGSNEETVLQLIQKRWDGLRKLRTIVGDEALEYHGYGGYELFRDTDVSSFETCVEKIQHLNSLLFPIIGEQEVFQIADPKIEKFGLRGVSHLIWNKSEGQIHTGRMMQALMSKAQDLHIPQYFGLPVKSIENDDTHAHVLAEGFSFRAKEVLVCVNGFVRSLLPDIQVIPARTQVLITKPISNLQIQGTYHFDEGFYYFRNVGDRVLFGGGRNLDVAGETTMDLDTTSHIQDNLDMLLKKYILPQTDFTVDMRWSGIMGFGDSALPLVTYAQPHIAVAVRCNGMGVALGSQTGCDGAELVLRKM